MGRGKKSWQVVGGTLCLITQAEGPSSSGLVGTGKHVQHLLTSIRDWAADLPPETSLQERGP